MLKQCPSIFCISIVRIAVVCIAMGCLSHIIADHIRTQPSARITFANYMNLALYHPDYGYYASNPSLIGTPGDFVTAPHLTSDFGELLAIQFEQIWRILDRPTPFTLVEMGAGQGLIIQDVCRYLHQHHPDCFAALHYIVVEASPALRRSQQALLRQSQPPGQGLQWLDWADIVDGSVTGCFFSNELVDAFPVHLIRWQEGQLYERYVSVIDKASATATPQFCEVIGPLSTPAIADYFDTVDIHWTDDHYSSGYDSEVNLAALDWLATVATKLHRGYVLTIDYGYPAHRYYSPARRGGTLQCYYQHAHHSDPYIHVGQQDITAHVDITALERHGTACGLHPIATTQQGLFLMALGVGDRLSALSQPAPAQPQSINDLLRQRDALHALINPMGMGGFQVLVQSKGLTTTQHAICLKGLDIPPMGL